MKYLNLKLKKAILAFCFEDYADLLSLECIIGRFLKNNEEDKKNTLKVLHILLDENLILAGWALKDGAFKYWDAKSDEIIKEIERKWNELGRELLLGDIVWFEITETGENEFKDLNNLPELKEADPFYFDD